MCSQLILKVNNALGSLPASVSAIYSYATKRSLTCCHGVTTLKMTFFLIKPYFWLVVVGFLVEHRRLTDVLIAVFIGATSSKGHFSI